MSSQILWKQAVRMGSPSCERGSRGGRGGKQSRTVHHGDKKDCDENRPMDHEAWNEEAARCGNADADEEGSRTFR